MGAIRLLIVDGSVVERQLLADIFNADGGFQVVGAVASGDEALRAITRCKPDVIAMDVQLTSEDGYAATKRIMESAPLPVVMMSSIHRNDETLSLRRATEAGAVAAVGKPPGRGNPGHAEAAAKLVQVVKLMAEVKVVRRWRRRAAIVAVAEPPPRAPAPPRNRKIQIVAIGASTGGPQALQELFMGLDLPFPLPIVVTQHIAQGFLPTLVGWLRQSTGHIVSIGADREPVLPGHIYLAPDNLHMGVNPRGELVMSETPADNGLRPSVAHLFRSVAAAYGPRAAGVLLTGMGRDGAVELKLLRDRGAATFAQNEETSVVYGMPGEACRLAAAQHELSPDGIAIKLNALLLQHA